MSPPPDHVPHTPDRRSSTQALFTAFRSLTGGRLKSPTPPPSVSSATSTPARTPSLGTIRPGSIPSPHSADGTLQRISQVTGQRTGKPVTGGPPELDDLIEQLHRNRPFAERAVAVDKICDILEAYPVQNILGLWSVASDLLLPEQPDDVAEAGYKLLKSCASLSDLASIERTLFFDAACLRKNDHFFDRRLEVITTLTNHGRDIDSCESGMVSFILTSLDSCFQASCDAFRGMRSKANGKRKAVAPDSDIEELTPKEAFVSVFSDQLSVTVLTSFFGLNSPVKSKDAYMLIYTRRSPSTQDAAAKDQPEPPALAKLKVDELSTALEHEAEEWELKCVC